MADERPRPDIDQVREALREHDKAREDEETPEEPQPEDDEPADDD
jgi:hypothetical protein